MRLGCVAPRTTYTASARLSRIDGIASIMTSIPCWERAAERQDDGFAAEAEPPLRRVGLDEGGVGNAVRNDFDLFRRHAVHGPQQFTGLLGHDDDLRRSIDDSAQDVALHGSRFRKDGVKVLTIGMVSRESNAKM